MFSKRRSFLMMVALTAGTAALLVRWITRKPTPPSYLTSLIGQVHHLPRRCRSLRTDDPTHDPSSDAHSGQT
jgi:hypothetical protein